MFMSSSNNEFTHSRQENTTTSVSDTNMASISIEAKQQQQKKAFLHLKEDWRASARRVLRFVIEGIKIWISKPCVT